MKVISSFDKDSFLKKAQEYTDILIDKLKVDPKFIPRPVKGGLSLERAEPKMKELNKTAVNILKKELGVSEVDELACLSAVTTVVNKKNKDLIAESRGVKASKNTTYQLIDYESDTILTHTLEDNVHIIKNGQGKVVAKLPINEGGSDFIYNKIILGDKVEIAEMLGSIISNSFVSDKIVIKER